LIKKTENLHIKVTIETKQEMLEMADFNEMSLTSYIILLHKKWIHEHKKIVL
jgi:hypothetical protein